MAPVYKGFGRQSGFTLIELMVVIVIIGVLASLAIPRFYEAVAKSRMAEAPRIISAYESAFLAYVVEKGEPPDATADLIMDEIGESQWFLYKPVYESEEPGIVAYALARMMRFDVGNELRSSYRKDRECFYRGSDNRDAAEKMIPNFFGSGCDN